MKPFRHVAGSLIILSLAACGALGGERSRQELSPTQQMLLGEFHALRPEAESGGTTWMLEKWDSESGLEKLISFPGKPGNAAAHFKRIDDLYRNNNGKNGKVDPALEEEGVRELLLAAELAECRFSPEYYPEFDRNDALQPDFVALRSSLQALLSSADRLERQLDNPDAANRRYQAALASGRHLIRARPSLVVYMTGVIFQLRAAQAYEVFLRRQGRLDAANDAKTFAERITELLRLFHWKANVALGTYDNFASLPVVLEVAANDSEMSWRAEAVIRLAIFRHGAPNQTLKIINRDPRWEREAERGLVGIAASDPSPAIRRLAAWAAVNIKPDMFSEMQHLF